MIWRWPKRRRRRWKGHAPKVGYLVGGADQRGMRRRSNRDRIGMRIAVSSRCRGTAHIARPEIFCSPSAIAHGTAALGSARWAQAVMPLSQRRCAQTTLGFGVRPSEWRGDRHSPAPACQTSGAEQRGQPAEPAGLMAASELCFHFYGEEPPRLAGRVPCFRHCSPW